MKGDWNKKEHWAPFCAKTGSLLDFTYSETGKDTDKILWKEVSEPLELKLKFKQSYRGRSAARFIFTSIDNDVEEYSMMLYPFCDMLKQTTLENGEVAGMFQVIKRGANFGIELISKENKE